VCHTHILKITIDNVAKKNSFIPEMMVELSDALTLLNDDDLWVGVLCAAGENFTGGSVCRNSSVPALP
jgi:enoyl-CoA hydratase